MATPPEEGHVAAVADGAETNPALPTNPATRHPTSAGVSSERVKPGKRAERSESSARAEAPTTRRS
jgi:hypothetical protein